MTFVKPVVAVASLNKDKINAVQQVFPDHSVVSVECPSGVSSQPVGLEETCKGATNRLELLRQTYPEAQQWIAIENGLVEIVAPENRWGDSPVVAYMDKDQKEPVIVQGAVIPTSFRGPDDLERYSLEIHEYRNQACEHFTGGHVTRQQVIAAACEIARYCCA